MEVFLRSVTDRHPDIGIPSAMILGRGRVTKIRDRQCSRKQVRLEPNIEDGTVTCTQLGRLPTELSHAYGSEGDKESIRHGDIAILKVKFILQ